MPDILSSDFLDIRVLVFMADSIAAPVERRDMSKSLKYAQQQ